MSLVITSSPLLGIGDNLALEWARVKAKEQAAPSPGTWGELLFYVNEPCVVLGRSRKVVHDLTEEALAMSQGFLSRRRSGGGTVYQDEGNLNFSVLVSREHPGLPKDPKGAAHHLLQALVEVLGDAKVERISDVTVGGKKVSGNAQYLGKGVLLHHGTLLLKADVPAMVRYLKLPPERPDIRHEAFVTDLNSLGFSSDVAGWVLKLSQAFGRLLNLPLSWAGTDAQELEAAKEKAGEWTDLEWVKRL